MKRLSLFLILILFYNKHFVFAQTNFSIKGKIKGISSGLLYLTYNPENKNFIKDSSQIRNDGSFSFKGKVTRPTSAILSLKREKRDDQNFTTFFIEPSAMTSALVLNKFSTAKFTGSKTQNEFALLNKLKEPVQKEMEPLVEEYNTANEAYIKAMKDKKDEDTINLLGEKADSIREKFAPYNAKEDSIDYKFFVSHPHSYVTAYMMRYHIPYLTLGTMEKYYNKFGSKLQQSYYGKYIKDEIEKLQGGSPGSIAKDFSKADINGDTLALSSFKGKKYVLLDFWASWCIPCRKGNPHLKEIYQVYKEKGLEIIGVSDDDSHPDKWKKAIEEDSLPWRHVLRGLDWDKIRKGEKNKNDISEKFGIHTLPTKILIDKNGVIIGRYNEDEDDKMDAKLKEVFGY